VTTRSKELALDDRQFELLLEGCARIPDEEQALQARFVALVGGRLGLRAGEITHMDESWINWRKRMIEIPRHHNCTKGKHGESCCGYCQQQAEQRVEYNAISAPEARLELLEDGAIQGFRPETTRQLIVAHQRHRDGDFGTDELDDQVHTILEASASDEWSIYENLETEAQSLVSEQDITLEAALDAMWRAKTDESERAVPFDWSARVEICIERFFDEFSAWPVSRTTTNRRVNKALREADELSESTTHCHGLRATAATHMAGKGMPTLALQSVLGWAQASTARSYVRASPENAARELHNMQSR
jgi:hypothetical protein